MYQATVDAANASDFGKRGEELLLQTQHHGLVFILKEINSCLLDDVLFNLEITNLPDSENKLKY